MQASAGGETSAEKGPHEIQPMEGHQADAEDASSESESVPDFVNEFGYDSDLGMEPFKRRMRKKKHRQPKVPWWEMGFDPEEKYGYRDGETPEDREERIKNWKQPEPDYGSSQETDSDYEKDWKREKYEKQRARDKQREEKIVVDAPIPLIKLPTDLAWPTVPAEIFNPPPVVKKKSFWSCCFGAEPEVKRLD